MSDRRLRARDGGCWPQARLYERVLKSWADFEVAAVNHLRLLGFEDVHRCPPGTPIIDARAEGVVAQVKARSSKPSEHTVRVLHSFMIESSVPLGALYSLTGFPPRLAELADACRIACFTLNEASEVAPVNAVARELRADAVPASALVVAQPVTVDERTANRALVDKAGLEWDRLTGGHGAWAKPTGWRRSLRGWMARGLSVDRLIPLMETTLDREPDDPWRYFAGCCWRTLDADASATRESQDVVRQGHGAGPDAVVLPFRRQQGQPQSALEAPPHRDAASQDLALLVTRFRAVVCADGSAQEDRRAFEAFLAEGDPTARGAGLHEVLTALGRVPAPIAVHGAQAFLRNLEVIAGAAAWAIRRGRPLEMDANDDDESFDPARVVSGTFQDLTMSIAQLELSTAASNALLTIAAWTSGAGLWQPSARWQRTKFPGLAALPPCPIAVRPAPVPRSALHHQLLQARTAVVAGTSSS